MSSDAITRLSLPEPPCAIGEFMAEISCWVMMVCSGASASATGTGVPIVGFTIGWFRITGGGGALVIGGGGGRVCIRITRPVYATSSLGFQIVVATEIPISPRWMAAEIIRAFLSI